MQLCSNVCSNNVIHYCYHYYNIIILCCYIISVIYFVSTASAASGDDGWYSKTLIMYLRDSFVESFRRIYVNEKIIYIRECVSIFTCIYMLCVREGGRVLARKTMKKGNNITNLNSVKLQPLVIFYLRIEYTVLWQGYS